MEVDYTNNHIGGTRISHMVTMKDIAREAQVSQPAVSAVLNDRTNCRVSPQTRERILRIARERDYQPNLAARLLRGKKSGIIAVFTGRTGSALQNEALKLIFAELQEHGLNCFTVPASDNGELKKKYRHLLAHDIEGFISFFIDFDFDRTLFQLPQVHVGVNKNDLDIQEDTGSAAAFLCRHLLEHGRRRFVFLCDRVGGNIFKHAAVEKTLRDFPERTELRTLEFFRNGSIVEEIFSAAERGSDAFFCANDHIAARLCRLLRSRNIRVPGDVAVTGFDGMAFAEYVTPSLTTMRIDPGEIARAAVELLVKRMKDPALPASVKIPCRFHCGESCGCRVPPQETFFFDKMLSVIS